MVVVVGDARGPPAPGCCLAEAAASADRGSMSRAEVDAVARLAMMDRAGVAAEVLYPNLDVRNRLRASDVDPT